jgi:hypothetical protein
MSSILSARTFSPAFRVFRALPVPLWLVLLLGALIGPGTLLAVPTNSPPRVLIMDETIVSGTNSWEAQAAQAAIPGCAVDVVSAANWYSIPATGNAGPTGFGFDQYRAIIVGDPSCGTGSSNYLAALTALNATKTNWTPACSGNVILMGVDNVCHAPSTNPGPAKTILRGIAFAVDDPAKTGFYYALSCYYDYDNPATNALLVPHLTGFGTFMVRNYPYTCFDACHIVATHPIFTNAPPLTDAELSNWGCSTHEGFNAWPANFVVMAIALTNGLYTATDGSNGVPYILVRGEGVKVISNIELGPPVATNNIGTSHTVCATLATNVIPRVNVPVTFTITNGPNAVTNFTTLTDSNGVACFTYFGNGGLGTDYITASYMDGKDHVNTSGTVTKLWVGACLSSGCPQLTCLGDGAWTYQFCVTNLTGAPLSQLTLFNTPAGVGVTPAAFTFAPPLGAGQVTNLSVVLTAPLSLSNLCLSLGAYTKDGALQCSVPSCLPLPKCCNRVVTNTLTWSSTVGNVSTYTYSITLQNISAAPVKFVGFGSAQSCVTFLPPLLDLTVPANGGPSLLLPSQTRTVYLQVQRTAPCPGTNSFYLTMLDTNMLGCCSLPLTLPPPRCVRIALPYDGTVLLTNAALRLSAIPNPVGPCDFRWVKFYDGATVLGDGAPSTTGGSGYELTVSSLSAGSHHIVAVAELDSGVAGQAGEVETSDPVGVLVLAPQEHPPDTDQNPHP